MIADRLNMMVNKGAGFRIQTVAKRTGVAAPTLRAWERRYGVPQPVRTGSAYRVYSEKDIEDIERLQKLCEAGMSVSEAAALLRAELADSRATTAVARAKPAEPATAESGGTRAGAESPGSYQQLVDGFIEAAQAMDLDGMEAKLAPMTSLGPAAEIYSEVLHPAMVRLGELWHAGEISIGHEHLATELVAGFARQLLRLAQPKYPRGTALLACVAKEQHSIPLYGLGFRLLNWGFRSAILGPQTPPSALAPAVRDLEPDLVGLSVTMDLEMSEARELFEGYAAACGSVPWLVGGKAASAMAPLIRRVGGHAAPSDEEALIQLMDRLLRNKQ